MTSKHNTDPPRPIHRPRLFGNAYERHKAYFRDFVDVYEEGSSPVVAPPRKSDFDVLKETHKFIREEGEASSSSERTWGDVLALKYEATLFKEFAVCDLKHYKSGNVALRWRTEEEVLSGAGESTCGNTRCVHHFAPSDDRQLPPLSTLEVPFAYIEHGEAKQALVKLVLCDRCTRKLTYKRAKEKEEKEKERRATEGAVDNSGAPKATKRLKRQRNEKTEGRGTDDREAVRQFSKDIDEDPPNAKEIKISRQLKPGPSTGRARRSASPSFS